MSDANDGLTAAKETAARLYSEWCSAQDAVATLKAQRDAADPVFQERQRLDALLAKHLGGGITTEWRIRKIRVTLYGRMGLVHILAARNAVGAVGVEFDFGDLDYEDGRTQGHIDFIMPDGAM